MLFYFWFFVFNVHFVHSLRSTAPHRIAFQNDYQNSYSNSNQNNLKRGNEDKETTNEYTESHLKPNLDTVNSFRGNKNRKSNTDQLFTEESNEDQLIERNIVPDSDSSIYSSSKYAEDKEVEILERKVLLNLFFKKVTFLKKFFILNTIDENATALFVRL